MRALRFSILVVTGLCALASCTSNEQRPLDQTSTRTEQSNTTTPQSSTTGSTTQTTPSSTPSGEMPIAPAHGGGTGTPVGTSSSNSSSRAANSTGGEQGEIDTSALDAKIVRAEAKAKAKNATQADRLAAASAYMERADIFMNAGRPSLYKYALRDYRRVLRYQPDNQQARQGKETIEAIYQQMGRPVPALGNEP